MVFIVLRIRGCCDQYCYLIARANKRARRWGKQIIAYLCPMQNTSILVTGGTGFIGSYLLRKLLKDGYTHIKATKRSTSKMDGVADIQEAIEWVDADILDVIALEDAMKDVRQVYHCAAMVSYDSRDHKIIRQVNVKGTENVVNAALAEKIDKLVYISSIAAIGRSEKHNHVTEKQKWIRKKGNTTYAISKHKAEMEVWRGIAEGLNAVIINPSIVLGSGIWQTGSTQMFYEVWKGLKFFPQGATGFVDVRDVVTLMIRMMESEVTGERFIANGENWSYQKLFTAMANTFQKPAPHIAFTPRIRSVAWRLEWLRSRLFSTQPMLTKETSAISLKAITYGNEKSIKTFHFQYRPLTKTIQETSEQLVESAKNGLKPMFLPL